MSINEVDRVEAAPNKRGLRLLLSAAAVSITGDGALMAAAPLMAAALTRDPFEVGLVAGSVYAAWLVVGLPAGALVDRWDRRKVMVLADLLRALVLGGFALLVALDLASIPALVATVFLVGVGTCFFDPAAQSLLPQLATRDKDALSKANGALWGIDAFGRSLAGPPLGAATFAVARFLPFAADALSFLVSALLVRLLPPTVREKTEHPPIFAAVRSGLAYVTAHSVLRRLVLGMGAYNFAWNLGFATFVLFAQERLGLGAVGFGLLLATGAVGGVLCGWLTPKFAKNVPAVTAYVAALSLQAVVWLVIVGTANLWVAGAAFAVLGGVSTAISVIGGTARQLATPDDLMARVVSGTRLVGIGAAALGAFAAGIISHFTNRVGKDVSLDTPMWSAATFALLCAVLFALSNRRNHSP